jgi:radical SAM protein with 4Fe4S-binding SPASM domain
MKIDRVKAANVIKGCFSYLRSSVTGSPGVRFMPLSVGVELTNRCNLNCPECVTGSGEMIRRKGDMDLDFYKRIITELKPSLLNVNLYFQGEPMLHPQFFSFISKSEGIHTSVSTNGSFLSVENSERIMTSGLNEIIVSIDGFDQEVYSKYRLNGDFYKVKEGIENLVAVRNRIGARVKIILQFLVNRMNEHQIHAITCYASDLNINLKLKSMQVNSKEDIPLWIPVSKKYSRYKKEGDNYSLKNSLPNRCARLWFNPVITWDGKVIPCCFDKNGEHVMGDLNHESFEEIWFGTRYMLFRRSILTERKMIPICRNCTSGLRGVKG